MLQKSVLQEETEKKNKQTPSSNGKKDTRLFNQHYTWKDD